MKITAFNPEYAVWLAQGTTTLDASTGSNAGYGPDVEGEPGDLSVVALRQRVSLASNMGDSTVGSVLTTVQSSPWVAQFAVPSNAASYGSNATRVSEVSGAGVASSSSRSDHIHDGIGQITSSSSNTLQRGTVNLRPGTGSALTVTDTDGDGEFDTVFIHSAGGSGSGSVPAWLAGDYRSYPTIPSSDDDEFEQNTSGVPAGWSAIPSGAPDTTSTDAARSHLRMVRNANSGTGVFGIYKAYTPSFPFRWEACISAAYLHADYNACGLFVAESGLTGKLYEATLNHNSGTSAEPDLIITRRAWTNRTTFSSGSTFSSWMRFMRSAFPVWVAIVGNSSTSLDLEISWDGKVWYEVEAAFNPGFTIGAVGLSVHSQNASERGEVFVDSIRRTV